MKRSKTIALRIVHGETVSSASTTSTAGATSARGEKRGRPVQTASPSGSSSTSAFARVRIVRPASTPGEQHPAPAVARAPVLDRGGERAEQQRGEQRLGHHGGADHDQRDVDRGEPHRGQRDPAAPQLRRHHADQRHDQRADDDAEDARGADPVVLARALERPRPCRRRRAARGRRGPERGRAPARGRVAVAARDRLRGVVVVARVVDHHVVRGDRDVADPQRQREREDQPDGGGEGGGLLHERVEGTDELRIEGKPGGVRRGRNRGGCAELTRNSSRPTPHTRPKSPPRPEPPTPSPAAVDVRSAPAANAPQYAVVRARCRGRAL